MRRRVHIIGLAALLCGSCQPLSDLRIDRRPVFITEPIDGSTRGRLLKATGDPQACAAWLTAAGLGFRPVADRTENGFCQVTGAVNLIDAKGEGDAPLLPARPMMACDLAAAVAIWRRQSVEPAARTLLGGGAPDRSPGRLRLPRRWGSGQRTAQRPRSRRGDRHRGGAPFQRTTDYGGQGLVGAGRRSGLSSEDP